MIGDETLDYQSQETSDIKSAEKKSTLRSISIEMDQPLKEENVVNFATQNDSSINSSQ